MKLKFPGGHYLLLFVFVFGHEGLYSQSMSGKGSSIEITPTLKAGGPNFGKAIEFRGNNTNVKLPPVVANLRSGTIELWFKAYSWEYNMEGRFLFSAYDSMDKINLGMHPDFYPDKQLLFGIYNTAWHWAASGVVPKLYTWYHIAGTWGKNGIKIFVNGKLCGTNKYDERVPRIKRNLIGSSSWKGSCFNGLIDEVRIWSTELPESVVRDWMDRGVDRSHPLYARLEAYYTFDTTAGSTVVDVTNRYSGVYYYHRNWQLQQEALNDDLYLAAMEKQLKSEQLVGLQREKELQTALLKNTQKNRNMIIAALLGVLALSGVIFYWRNKHNKLVFRNKLTETELNLFRSQMNPHFMFNALNSIYSYVVTNDKQSAAKYLHKFSGLMHIILENSTNKLVTLTDDLKALELYLELEAERLEHKFSYEIKVDESIDTDRVMVPPMILQPFLENSVWHGMLKKEKDGKIQLHVGRNGELLECVITDNGGGFRKTNGKGLKEGKKSYGINITRQRIENLNKTHRVSGYCDVMEIMDEHSLPAGVKVKVGLPLELEA